ncbi:hypothetical protein HRR83_000242 [Exophiala dermatitidis]|uniref:SRR1-like domain-containing protein n=2 Tax=Exophiala dermatitidis TaxID=5970 RepID=H6C8Q6_EXODN|nr:uncharacterized protein HMPREF1120_08443 [Exophiala dermatitidis NIH/UT8656]KAJ4523595.1 hypothetical protein HRR73_002778 [Exophiala dermatitidis]EHY60483.1 hypothetical protein HMPREF1120_08443 [Exophiala dermatitidis NIH/UT8656]KAJ4524626.1 hypothetical protein HRR75_000216 [Exophiala dermatitidis]KAJ4527489.1 hypothetical protein HRR74_000243 [Exophiala dermatitidis]KAJ4531059.1 hypothetical protein HRR76_008740 [Exophiala dermatitidis]
MPHTSRKKKVPHKKRQEVVDDDGWTRVTSTNTARPVTHHTNATTNGSVVTSQHGNDGAVAGNGSVTSRPMKPAKGITVEAMRAQYDKVEAKWLESDLCRTLRDNLRRRIEETPDADGRTQQISNCVIFGSGSFCGDELHWIDRHESAYYQIAAFKTMVDTIEQVQGRRPACYAQEPCYNDLDGEFLASVNVTRIDHPKGFELLDRNSVAYSPAAERNVELEIILHDPRIWLHRSLDHIRPSNRPVRDEGLAHQDPVGLFVETHEFLQLPALDVKNFPFHGSMLWWRKDGAGEEEINS